MKADNFCFRQLGGWERGKGVKFGVNYCTTGPCFKHLVLNVVLNNSRIRDSAWFGMQERERTSNHGTWGSRNQDKHPVFIEVVTSLFISHLVFAHCRYEHSVMVGRRGG